MTKATFWKLWIGWRKRYDELDAKEGIVSRDIEVLVVEDSQVAQILIVHILNSAPGLRVIGTANNGEQALKFLQRSKPDVVVMDIHMPGMDGFETTRRIMETMPVPIVICSASLNPAEVDNTFRAMEAGALALVGKPVGLGHSEYDRMAYELVTAVRVMSEVKVVRRWSKSRHAAAPAVGAGAPGEEGSTPKVVGIGASTGGPPALQQVLSRLPAEFPLPVLIVQHISPGFLPGLVEWLNHTSGIPVRIAQQGERLEGGKAYIAPDGFHLGIGKTFQVALSVSEPENGLRPSVGYLFRSMHRAVGGRAIAVLMTGMGDDGASEMKNLADAGALTIAQDAESSVVHGMPGEAIKRGAAQHVLAPEGIGAALVKACGGVRKVTE